MYIHIYMSTHIYMYIIRVDMVEQKYSSTDRER